MQKTRRNAISNQKIDAAYFYGSLAWIRKQCHFTAGQLRNPWQMLAEPSVENHWTRWSTAFPPTFGEKIAVNFDPLTTET